MTNEKSRVHEWLCHTCLRGECRPRRDWTVLGPVIQTQLSRIYHAVAEGENLQVAVKVTKADLLDQDDLTNGVKAAAQKLGATSDFKAPRLLATETVDSLSLTAIDWIDGKTVEQLIGDKRVPKTTKQDVVGQSAQLLGRLLVSGQTEFTTLDTCDFLNDIALIQIPERKMGRTIEKGLEWLNEHAREVIQQPLLTADLHGDYKPANLIWNDGAMAVIDGYFRGSGPAIHDIAQFLNHIALSSYQPNQILNSQFIKDLEETFISECNWIPKTDLGTPLSWLRIQKIIILAIERTQTKGSFAASQYLAFCLRREIARLQLLHDTKGI